MADLRSLIAKLPPELRREFIEAVRDLPGQEAPTEIGGLRSIPPGWPVAFNDKGRPVAVLRTAVAILSHDPDWASVLAWDELKEAAVIRRPPPWFPEDRPARPYPPNAAWSDADDTRLVCWFSSAYGLNFKTSTAFEAVTIVAQHQSFHPVREYLDGLRWDGVARLGVTPDEGDPPREEGRSWLTTHLGAEDSPYVRDVGRWWPISAVARVYSPGEQADHVLIFEGLTGIGKSSLLRALAVRLEWYLEFKGVEIGSQASLDKLRGKWIVEMPELDGMDRAEANKAKAFFSGLCDSYRPSYGRRSADFVRQCIFGGSTNDDEYLKDPTGNRRFWPVMCASKQIDLKAFKQIVPQLWAEAVHRYRQGERWWPDTEEERRRCAEQQEQRFDAEIWEEVIANWLEVNRLERGFVTLNTLLEKALHLDPGRRDQRAKNRLVKVLKRLGWVRDWGREVGEVCRVYRPGPQAKVTYNEVKAEALRRERERERPGWGGYR